METSDIRLDSIPSGYVYETKRIRILEVLNQALSVVEV